MGNKNLGKKLGKILTRNTIANQRGTKSKFKIKGEKIRLNLTKLKNQTSLDETPIHRLD
jgi:hypothetical protein